MARKTVLRRLMKRLPSSADIDALVESDNETFDLKQAAAPAAPPVNPMEALRAKIGVAEPTGPLSAEDIPADMIPEGES
jgi:recombinational DNA repair protein RecT